MSAPIIPTARGKLPLLGHALPLLRKPVAFLNSLPAQGDLVRVKIGPVDAVMVCDAELANEVFRDDRTYDKGGVFVDRAREVVHDNLSTCPHSMHRRQRRLLQPAFHNARMPAYAEVMATQIERALAGWRDGQVLDVPREMSVLTVNVLNATMFSDTLSERAVRESYDDAEVLVSGILKRMVMPETIARLPLFGNRAFHQAAARLRRTVSELIEQRRVTGADHGDLLSALFLARDPENPEEGLTADEIVDQVLTFHLAGSETTAMALSWALHLVAAHPEVERRLHAEVDTVLNGRTASHADLPRLDLTARVITESLRVWTPGWLFTRLVSTDTELGGHQLAAGTTVAYSPYLIHHRPDLYPDPERFDPDRWDTSTGTTPPRTAFIPFAAGARKCIGDKFSLTEATLALATIAGRWRLEHASARQVRPALSFVLRPHKLRMRAIRRQAGERAVS
ncbi:cytochrome P450 [Actinokineospora sp. NBRC 105648]|uniref:cytochrome P450 n=1 Tax=Actinokineospora sp. NBRC 105648 TaxID=3032206 RepID=UPI0024A31596|nr:cytochrome P450 [Actinokineospora sp. NBRC 105648]GLZ40475.1 cytochrome P450 [Actinokineospora sp. NBRC 105648]